MPNASGSLRRSRLGGRSRADNRPAGRRLPLAEVHRPLRRSSSWLVGAAMSLFHLYTTFFGFFDAPIQRAVFFIFVFVLGYAFYPARFTGKLDARASRPGTTWS